MINKSNPFRHLAVAVFACLMAASCSDVTDDGTALPDGKYPMTFTASVDGLSAPNPASRTTTDADGKTSWTVDDPVAISMDGGASHKVYKISDAGTGAMVADGEANTLYWQKSNETKTLAAWHPVSCTVGSDTDNGEVDITDQRSGFGTLENILHAPAQGYTYSSSHPVAFVFRHALAKVKVALKKGDGMTDDDLSSATVRLTGYTAGTLGYNGMTGSEGSNGYISPKAETAGAIVTPYTYTALVIPQQMQGKKFIKVTIGASGAARDYFYTPTNSTDARLEAGKQYNYTITVKKTGLEVAVVPAPAWGTGGETTGGSEVSSFRVKIPTVSGVTPTIEGTTGNEGEIYTTADNSFSITLSEGDGVTGFNIKGGVCDVKRTVGNGSYKFTYSNIRSDLELVYGDYAEVGDYYYADGTWSPDYTANGSSACIGIVFKAGAVQGDVASNYDGRLPDGIHGYVVALTDALTYAGEWGVRETDENNEFLPNLSSNTDTKYNGYTQTKYILDTHSTDLTRYEAFSAVKDYTPAAPANSSGWYLPSMKQLSDVWQLYKGAAGNMLYDRLNAISSDNLFQTGNAGGNHNKDNLYRYWTSTEKNSTDAWYVVFDTGGTIDAYAKDNGYDRLCRARAILTF
ncbi:fimbrillin family protein [Phocaeicola sartorii]|uniref:fimbrillin family protein n=1 Tax=Phocaeicola sartorii TaxID=671267 RepID=UPI001F576D44|nr:fimbrillin family protein [Phocaeicola sartorii]